MVAPFAVFNFLRTVSALVLFTSAFADFPRLNVIVAVALRRRLVLAAAASG